MPRLSAQFILPKLARVLITRAPISILIMGSLKLCKSFWKKPSLFFLVKRFLPYFSAFAEISFEVSPSYLNSTVLSRSRLRFSLMPISFTVFIVSPPRIGLLYGAIRKKRQQSCLFLIFSLCGRGIRLPRLSADRLPCEARTLLAL